jgi:hypothetical protein
MKKLTSHSRIDRKELDDEMRVVIDKYFPRVVDGLITDVSGEQSIRSIVGLSMHTRHIISNTASIVMYSKPNTLGLWFAPAGIILYGDTPHAVDAPSGEKVFMGRTPQVSFPYHLFGFTIDEIREMQTLSIDIALMFPSHHREEVIVPDMSHTNNIPRVMKSHRILFNSEEIESFRALVSL